MTLQIPTYRARKINIDEYVEGYYFQIFNKCYILCRNENGKPSTIEIDTATLAIHFPDMKKDKFISLNDDGIDLMVKIIGEM